MFPFKQDLSAQQVNYSKWIENTCEYVIVHHTGTVQGTLWGNLKTLLGLNRASEVSCHFIVDGDGSAYKLADPKLVTWHAWQSNWGSVIGLNYHSLGIETIGPDFTQAQRDTVKKLIEHLMWVFKIPKERVLRHADITWQGSSKRILWDGKTKSRKVDIADSFWNQICTSWQDYQSKLTPKAQ